MTPPKAPIDFKTMSFGDHLDELRRRILLALVVPVPISIITFLLSNPILLWLVKPANDALKAADLPDTLQAISPTEPLMVKLKLSIILAIVLSGPWIIWQIWLFIKPGLFKHEQRFVHLLLPGSAVLTVSGLALMYWVMLPLMMAVLIKFGTSIRTDIPSQEYQPDAIVASADQMTIPMVEEDPANPAPGQIWVKMPQRILKIAALITEPPQQEGDPPQQRIEILQLMMGSSSIVAQQYRLNDYIHFVLLLMLGISIAFQMPLVILLLGWVGLASADWLRARRRYALLICGVVAAMITPADVISMMAMLVPLYGLYELGIILLVMAPASRVAEGTVFRPWQKSGSATDKSPPSSTISRSAKDPQNKNDEHSP